jgi:hypothetical protein
VDRDSFESIIPLGSRKPKGIVHNACVDAYADRSTPAATGEARRVHRARDKAATIVLMVRFPFIPLDHIANDNNHICCAVVYPHDCIAEARDLPERPHRSG